MEKEEEGGGCYALGEKAVVSPGAACLIRGKRNLDKALLPRLLYFQQPILTKTAKRIG